MTNDAVFGSGVKLLLGTDGGTMIQGSTLPVAGGCNRVQPVDVNRDGRRDLVVVNGSNVCLLLAQ